MRPLPRSRLAVAVRRDAVDLCASSAKRPTGTAHRPSPGADIDGLPVKDRLAAAGVPPTTPTRWQHRARHARVRLRHDITAARRSLLLLSIATPGPARTRAVLARRGDLERRRQKSKVDKIPAGRPWAAVLTASAGRQGRHHRRPDAVDGRKLAREGLRQGAHGSMPSPRRRPCAAGVLDRDPACRASSRAR